MCVNTCSLTVSLFIGLDIFQEFLCLVEFAKLLKLIIAPLLWLQTTFEAIVQPEMQKT